MENPRGSAVIFFLFILMMGTAVVYSQGDISIDVSKAVKVGDNITAKYTITNPSKEKKNYTIVLVCHPATTEHPGCIQQIVEVEPGQTVSGTVQDTTEFPIDAEASVEVSDGVTGLLVKQQNSSLRIVSPDDIACGDSKCDEDFGESYDNCPIDCEKKIICGDGACDEPENSSTCLKDCPLPTTSTTVPKSPEPAGFVGYLPYAGGAVAVIVVMLAVYLVKKRKENKAIEKQREEFDKWKRDREALK
jgi:hypothetical protein